MTTKPGKVSDLHRQYFREIFNLEAKDGMISYEGLKNLFVMVDFKPNEKQTEEFKKLFKSRDEITFDDFLQIFSLKGSNEYTEIEVKNAFRLLSKEYSKMGHIKIDRIQEILKEQNLQDHEIFMLTSQLTALCDEEGYINFEELVKNSF